MTDEEREPSTRLLVQPGLESRVWWSVRVGALSLSLVLLFGVLPTPATAATSPDLIVPDISTNPTSPVGGGSTTVVFSVRNQGNAGAGGFRTKLYIDGSEVGSADVPSLAAGVTQNYQTTGVVLSAGAHTLRVVADTQLQVSESIETNNVREETTTWSAAAAPDLVVDDIWTEPSPP